MGVITSNGYNVKEFWHNTKYAKSGIIKVKDLRIKHCGSQFGGYIKNLSSLNKNGKRLDRGTLLASIALNEAMEQANLLNHKLPSERIGIVVGTCLGGLDSFQSWLESYWKFGLNKTKSYLAYQSSFSSGAEYLGRICGATGPILSISTACAASNNAIGLGTDLIRSKKADIIIVAGFDPLIETAYNGFTSVNAMDSFPCKPYSSNRSGLTLGEGAGVMILERFSSAKERSVEILAEVLGYGLSLDGYNPVAPHPQGDGASRAIKTALREAKISPLEVDYIKGHGTGTLLNDSSETKAIEYVFGKQARNIPISSIKGAIGHTLGASGTIEGIATICALREGILPPTVGYEKQDPQLQLDYIPYKSRKKDIKIALSNSFGFGGNNAVVAYSKSVNNTEHLPKATNKVVITGIGVVTPHGYTKEAFWDALKDSTPLQLTEVESIQSKYFGKKYIGKVDVEIIKNFFEKKAIRRLNKNAILSLFSSKQALEDSDILIKGVPRDRIGIVSSHAFSIMDEIQELFKPTIEQENIRIKPSIFPHSVFNSSIGYVASHFQLLGPGSTFTGQEAAGGMSIVQAMELIKKGSADAMLCVGTEVVTNELVDIMSKLNVLSDQGKPFDTNYDGFTLSEASVTLVLESEESAKKRNAEIYAEIIDYNMKADHLNNGEGLIKSINDLLIENKVQPDCIFASANGLNVMDENEIRALKKIFVSRIPPLAAVKEIIGETFGAGVNLNIVAAIKSMKLNTLIPKDSNVTKEYYIDKDSISRPLNKGKISTCLVNASNHGGTHFTLLLGENS